MTHEKMLSTIVSLLLCASLAGVTLPTSGAAAQVPPPSYGGSVTVTTQPAPYPTPYPQAYPPMTMPMPRREVAYEEGMAVPPGAHIIERTRRGLWITGLTLFLSFYAISVLAAASSKSGDITLLWVPAAGPWILWASDDSLDEGQRFLLAFDGLAQAIGIVMFAVGMTATRQYVVYGDRDRDTSPRWALAPYVRPDGGGLSLTVF